MVLVGFGLYLKDRPCSLIDRSQVFLKRGSVSVTSTITADGAMSNTNAFIVLPGKGLMITYVLVIGLTDLRFQKLKKICSTSSFNSMASGSCTSEEEIQAVEICFFACTFQPFLGLMLKVIFLCLISSNKSQVVCL